MKITDKREYSLLQLPMAVDRTFVLFPLLLYNEFRKPNPPYVPNGKW